jgi:uncharacterized protein (DUF1697 family)
VKNIFVALLRGINVGGSAVMKMTDVKKQFEEAGLSDVKTYIQSGNVIFTSPEKDISKISLKLKKQFQKSFNHRGEIFIFTPQELKTAFAHCPFEPEKNEEKQLCHLMFLSDKPGRQYVDKLMAMSGEEYSFAVYDKVLYYAYPREIAGRRRNINFEKVLGVTGTARSWKVISKLIELSSE